MEYRSLVQINKLENEILMIELKTAKEAKLREDNPALQDAWEKYLIIKKLLE